MPVNVFDKKHVKKMWEKWGRPESIQDKRTRNEQLRRELEALKKRQEFQEELLKMWGYKPWKRKDLRKRPLRTKRSWVSLRARVREFDIVRMHMIQGFTFREIGQALGISHVAAWKRYEWAMESFRLEDAYRARCFEEIAWKMGQVDRLEPVLADLPVEERRRRLIGMGLIPPGTALVQSK